MFFFCGRNSNENESSGAVSAWFNSHSNGAFSCDKGINAFETAIFSLAEVGSVIEIGGIVRFHL